MRTLTVSPFSATTKHGAMSACLSFLTGDNGFLAVSTLHTARNRTKTVRVDLHAAKNCPNQLKL